MTRLVVDPGVLVSAALSPDGSPAKIVEEVRAGRLLLVVSPGLMSELEDVLSRPKIAAHLDPAAWRRLRQVLAKCPGGRGPAIRAHQPRSH